MPAHLWSVWAIVLIAQNFAFTFVSRARNSGSLPRHIVAAIFSNLIFFIQFAFMTDKAAYAMMHGDLGLLPQIGISLYYTLWTVSGSILAHYFSLKTEKGKGAVGANKKYAQIPVVEWEAVQTAIYKGHPNIVRRLQALEGTLIDEEEDDQPEEEITMEKVFGNQLPPIVAIGTQAPLTNQVVETVDVPAEHSVRELNGIGVVE